jgi:hypothetical protein
MTSCRLLIGRGASKGCTGFEHSDLAADRLATTNQPVHDRVTGIHHDQRPPEIFATAYLVVGTARQVVPSERGGDDLRRDKRD